MTKKGFILFIVLLSQLFIFHCNASAQESIGDIYITDTSAYIDCNIIPVYEFNNYPFVIAEDLAGYGFDIKWNPYERTLDLTYDMNKKYYPYSLEDVSISLGQVYEGSVYQDDVIVRLNGDVITAYSLGGRMLISLDEMWRIGDVNWYDESKTISVTTRKFMNKNADWRILLQPYFLSEKISWYTLFSDDHYFEILDEYDNIVGYYNETAYIDDIHKLCFSKVKEKITHCLNYIENDVYLYERANLYHMAYNAIEYQNALIEMYDNINNQTIEYVETNRYWIEELPYPSYEEYYNRCEAVIENTLKYIDFSYSFTNTDNWDKI